jgi:hypothetical protein
MKTPIVTELTRAGQPFRPAPRPLTPPRVAPTQAHDRL